MIWNIAVIVVILLLVLAVFPGILMYAIIFARKEGTPLTSVDISKTTFANCTEEIEKGFAFFKNLPSEKRIIENGGLTLCCDYYDRGSGKTAVFLHGYRSTPENNFFDLGPFLWDMGYNLAMVHQRGHSDSGGKKIGIGISEAEDLLKWADYFAGDEAVSQLVFCGTSMGCSTIAYASDRLAEASKNKAGAMILDCGFVSVYDQIKRDIGKRHVPPFAVMGVIALSAKLFSKIDIKEKTTERLKKSEIPAFFLHGKLDETVPVSDTVENYEAAAGRKEIVVVENAYHAQAFTAGKNEAKEKLKAFLEG